MQKLTLVRFDKQDNFTAAEYECDFVVDCAGDSIWADTEGRKVHVTGITVVTNAFENEIMMQVSVTHDSTWDIYTDSGFEEAISKALGFAVSFTEQGMQEDEYASMEG